MFDMDVSAEPVVYTPDDDVIDELTDDEWLSLRVAAISAGDDAFECSCS